MHLLIAEVACVAQSALPNVLALKYPERQAPSRTYFLRGDSGESFLAVTCREGHILSHSKLVGNLAVAKLQESLN
jgi:hypothetical protein